MSQKKTILAFAGSNSSTSINHRLITIAASYFEKVDVKVISLRDYEAPVYGIDLEKEKGFPESMKSLQELMNIADGYLVSVPEHNGSMPAVFKNSIDWLSRMGGKIFQEKPTVFLSATPGGRAGASVLQHLERIMPYRGAQVVGLHGVGNFHEKADVSGLTDDHDVSAIRALISELESLIIKA